MRSYLLTFTLFILHTGLFAQASHDGFVTLKSTETIQGQVDINAFINSAIVTTEDGRQLTYHASMIDHIATVDECDFRRQYRCLDYRSNSFFDRLEKKIFQVVAEGEVTLLRRVFEYDVFDASDEYSVEEFYFLNEEQEVKKLRNFRRQVLPMMDSHAEQMMDFRERNRIVNMNRELNMYLMVSFYNRLHELEGEALTLK